MRVRGRLISTKRGLTSALRLAQVDGFLGCLRDRKLTIVREERPRGPQGTFSLKGSKWSVSRSLSPLYLPS